MRAGRGAVRGPRQRHRPVRRRAAARERRADRDVPDAFDHRDRPGEPARGGGARRDEPGGEQGRGAVRPVLRARPVQPGGVLGRRQRGGELRRGALPQERVHRAPRDRPGDRHAVRRADLARRRHRRDDRLRPARRVHRLGGHARHRDQDRGQADAGARGGAPAAGRVRHRRAEGGRAVSDIIARRHRARRDRDDGRAGHRGRRGGRALQLPGRSGRGAAGGTGRPGRGGRGGAVDRARAVRGGRGDRDPGRPTTRPSGRASGPGASRRSPRWAGSARRTSCRTAWCRGRRSARCWPGSPRCPQTRASGWPTCSTPGTGTCTRWCSTTTRCPARPRRPRRCPARSWTPAWSTAARSPASTASGWTSPGTCRRCSAPTTWTPCSWSGARSTRPACATRARSSPPPGCAARCRATGGRRTRP